MPPITAPSASSAAAAASGVGFSALGVPAKLVALLTAQQVTEPFPIQEATLPDSLAGRDVLGQGRTGSGKTLAFALPLVARLASDPMAPMRGRPRALVLVPTRELATQVAAVIEPLAAAYDMKTVTVFGGVTHGAQRKAFATGVEIVVACPGRLLDHMQAGDVQLDRIEVCVLDEADHMADQGFLPMVRRILDQTPANGQRLLFSATLADGVDMLISRYLTNPVSHAAGVEAPVLLEHRVLVVEEENRVDEIAKMAREGRVVVFTRTKHRAKQLAKKLDAIGVGAVDLHGNLSQNARERNLAAFSDGTATALVATDIAARGIHVDDVPLVVHADPPVEHKAYTHRSGRTARAGAAGQVVTIATPDQVGEVRDLLRKAGVTAVWEGIPVRAGAPASKSAPSRSSAPRSSTPRSTAPRSSTSRTSAPRSSSGNSSNSRPSSPRSGSTGRPSGQSSGGRSR